MNACLAASCTDGILDGDETAKDCGGSCLPCAVGQPCLVQSDCDPGYCKAGVCAPPSCSDALKDGNESDVDCGGPMCPKCAAGKTCLAPGDCQTGVNGQPTCAGTCGFACAAGFGDCDPVVGCETDTTKPANCGTCNVSCSAYCVNGSCNDPVTITAGYSHNCAVLKDGSVYCWGFNQLGEVGDGTTGNKIMPTKIALPLAATAISAKGVFLGGVTYSAHTCAILLDQSVWCWGGNANGELGQGDTAVYAGPVKVKNLASINRLVVGGAHTCAVNANNDLYCWGRNTNGQIGNALVTPVLLPQLILPGVTSKLALGSVHTCIVKTDGNPYCWGGNSNGQLGSGNLTGTNVPGAAIGLLLGSKRGGRARARQHDATDNTAGRPRTRERYPARCRCLSRGRCHGRRRLHVGLGWTRGARRRIDHVDRSDSGAGRGARDVQEGEPWQCRHLWSDRGIQDVVLGRQLLRGARRRHDEPELGPRRRRLALTRSDSQPNSSTRKRSELVCF
jgi:hypothetical protein